jgi:hypothetical protein
MTGTRRFKHDEKIAPEVSVMEIVPRTCPDNWGHYNSDSGSADQ